MEPKPVDTTINAELAELAEPNDLCDFCRKLVLPEELTPELAPAPTIRATPIFCHASVIVRTD